MRRSLFTVIVLVLCTAIDAGAQFREYGTSRSGLQDISTNTSDNLIGTPGDDGRAGGLSDTATVKTDTLAGFSMKRMIRGYTRKDTLTPGYMFTGALFCPGAAQIYNRDYWKLPILYGGIAAGIGAGIWCNNRYMTTGDESFKTWRSISYASAGLFQWAALLDGTICYDTGVKKPVPAKSTIYSILLPGLGQANNGDWWKIPIFVGGFVGCGYAIHINNMQYQRFKYIYTVASDPTSGYTGAISASQAEWYKDLYRKYRDYSILATILVYALNIIDANVFAHMADFDVSDNIASVDIEPTVILPPDMVLASSASTDKPALGLKMNFRF